MTKYYEAVSVSEELPDKAGWYITCESGVMYWSGSFWSVSEKSAATTIHITHWLRPSADVERMREALVLSVPILYDLNLGNMTQPMPEQRIIDAYKASYEALISALEAGKIEK